MRLFAGIGLGRPIATPAADGAVTAAAVEVQRAAVRCLTPVELMECFEATVQALADESPHSPAHERLERGSALLSEEAARRGIVLSVPAIAQPPKVVEASAQRRRQPVVAAREALGTALRGLIRSHTAAATKIEWALDDGATAEAIVARMAQAPDAFGTPIGAGVLEGPGIVKDGVASAVKALAAAKAARQ